MPDSFPYIRIILASPGHSLQWADYIIKRENCYIFVVAVEHNISV